MRNEQRRPNPYPSKILRSHPFHRCAVRAWAVKIVNLKSDMPVVREALQRLDRELAFARQEKTAILKLVHGYGSSGAGGEIRIAVQKRLRELADRGEIRGCIFGENWLKSDELTWKVLQSKAELKNDSDLGRKNPGSPSSCSDKASSSKKLPSEPSHPSGSYDLARQHPYDCCGSGGGIGMIGGAAGSTSAGGITDGTITGAGANDCTATGCTIFCR